MGEIERIKAALTTESDPTSSFKLLIQLTWELASKELEAMHTAFSEASLLVEQVSQILPSAPYQIMLLRAFIMAKHDQATEALPIAEEALHWFVSQENYKGQVLSLRVIGLIYSLLGCLDKAMQANKDGLELMAFHRIQLYEEERTPLEFVFLNNIGSIYSFLGRHEEALSHLLEALDYVKDTLCSSYVFILCNISLTYMELGKNDEALAYSQKALAQLSQTALGPYYYHLCYHGIGMAYKGLSQYDEAMSYLLKGLQSGKDSGIKFVLIDSYLQIGKTLVEHNKIEEAFPYALQALEVATEINANELLREAHMLAATCFEKLGDYPSATKHLKEYLNVNKQVVSKELEEQLNQYSMAFKIEEAKKDAEIHKLINVELKQKNEEIELKAKELEESHRNIAILSRIGQEITSSLEIDEVLNTLYENLRTLMKVNVLGIGVYEEDTNIVDYKMFIEESVRLPVFKANLDEYNGYSATCIKTREAIIENDVENASHPIIPLFGKKPGNRTPNSLIYYPLMLRDKIIGVITIQSYDKNAYNEQDIEAFKILATYIAIALNNSQQSEALKIAISELEISSTTDPLTELYNRRYMLGRIDIEREHFRRSTQPFSIIITDIDHFKDINDTYGHDCGDFVLKELAVLMKNLLRKIDYIARWGGEEFLILLTETDAKEAFLMAERLRKQIESHTFVFKEHRVNVTMTFGISEYQDEPTMEDAFKRADRALYQGKNNGRNQSTVS